jgi:cobalt-zinc-cadmium efflux system outer membrane protein
MTHIRKKAHMHMMYGAVVALVLALLLTVGCSVSPGMDAWPARRPLGADLPTFRPSSTAPRTAETAARLDEPSGMLTLRAAWAAALKHNPDLASFAWEVRAAEARGLQASLPPNPEADVAVENIGGSGDFSGADLAETTVSISQVLELAGKRQKRTRVAGLESRLVGWDYEARRVAVLTEVAQRFIDVLAAQRRLALAQQNADLATTVLDTVDKRIKAGAISPIERDKQRVETVAARVALERARRNLTAARQRLAATWGSTAPQFEAVAGALVEVRPLPSLQALADLVAQNPDIARWTTEMAQRRAAVALAKAQGVPDLTAGVGVRRFNESDDTALIFEFSLPLPIFNRNQGDILAARLNVAKAIQEQRAAEVTVKTELAAAYQELAAAHTEAVALRDEALPAAQRAFDATQEGFQRGFFNYLAVLDAQRTLIDTRSRYVEALAAYHSAVVDVEGLIGQSIETLPTVRAPFR